MTTAIPGWTIVDWGGLMTRPGPVALAMLLLTLAVSGSGLARASILYGVSSQGYISGNNLFPFQSWADGFPNPIATTGYTSPVLAASGSNPGGNLVESGSAWASAGDGSLRGYSNGAVTCSNSSCVDFGGTAEFQIYWYDTLFIGGLPAGTPVDLLVTIALDSTVGSSGPCSGQLCSGAFADSNATVSSQEVSATNNGSDNGLITQSMVAYTTAGSALDLSVELEGGASAVSDGSGSYFATADASDTANTYITVLTPGATYTTASGATYTAPAVPEPASFWLLAMALPALGVRARHRVRQRVAR